MGYIETQMLVPGRGKASNGVAAEAVGWMCWSLFCMSGLMWLGKGGTRERDRIRRAGGCVSQLRGIGRAGGGGRLRIRIAGGSRYGLRGIGRTV